MLAGTKHAGGQLYAQLLQHPRRSAYGWLASMLWLVQRRRAANWRQIFAWQGTGRTVHAVSRGVSCLVRYFCGLRQCALPVHPLQLATIQKQCANCNLGHEAVYVLCACCRTYVHVGPCRTV